MMNDDLISLTSHLSLLTSHFSPLTSHNFTSTFINNFRWIIYLSKNLFPFVAFLSGINPVEGRQRYKYFPVYTKKILLVDRYRLLVTGAR